MLTIRLRSLLCLTQSRHECVMTDLVRPPEHLSLPLADMIVNMISRPTSPALLRHDYRCLQVQVWGHAASRNVRAFDVSTRVDCIYRPQIFINPLPTCLPYITQTNLTHAVHSPMTLRNASSPRLSRSVSSRSVQGVRDTRAKQGATIKDGRLLGHQSALQDLSTERSHYYYI